MPTFKFKRHSRAICWIHRCCCGPRTNVCRRYFTYSNILNVSDILNSLPFSLEIVHILLHQYLHPTLASASVSLPLYILYKCLQGGRPAWEDKSTKLQQSERRDMMKHPVKIKPFCFPISNKLNDWASDFCYLTQWLKAKCFKWPRNQKH